jgi:hypothetical protein
LDQSSKKRGLFSRLTPNQGKLFTALSAKNWRDYDPELNLMTKQLMADRDGNKIANLAEDWTQDWQGRVSKSGLLQFLTKGYRSEEQPGGFTAFMFHPSRIRSKSNMELEETIRSTLGEGKATEAMIKSYSKQDWYLPKTVADADIQLTTCRRFLEKLTCEGSVAVQGYLQGEKLLEKHAQVFERAILVDKLYLVKFLHLLDTIFQSFLKEFLNYMQEERPVRKTRQKLCHFMKDWVNEIMRDLEISQTPTLELPPALEALTK